MVKKATAYVFPGQGSQYIGMLSDLMPHYTLIADTFTKASEAVGYDIWQLIQNGPEEKLNQTEYTQVAMLTADIALYNVLRQQGIAAPKIMAGHSLGEYAALVAAGSLSLTHAVRLVAHRGQLMQSAIPLGKGAMAAIIGLTDAEIKNLCRLASVKDEEVSPANYNAIGQVVVAGHTPAVERLIDLANDSGARLAKVLPVSVPCHCPLLQEAAKLFADSLANTPFATPAIEVISNVDLSCYTSAAQIRLKLKEQLYHPVRWVETIQLFKNRNIDWIIECGPGKVLTGLVKRIDKSFKISSVEDAIKCTV